MPDVNGQAPGGVAAAAPGGFPRTYETVTAELDRIRQVIHQLGQRFLELESDSPIPLGRPVMTARKADRERAWKAQREHARSVLLRFLSFENQQRYALGKDLIIRGSRGTVFHIDPSDWTGNIKVLDPGGSTLEEWCVHPDLYDPKNDWYMPSEYAVAVQVMALQTDEAKVRATANVEYY